MRVQLQSPRLEHHGRENLRISMFDTFEAREHQSLPEHFLVVHEWLSLIGLTCGAFPLFSVVFSTSSEAFDAQ